MRVPGEAELYLHGETDPGRLARSVAGNRVDLGAL